MAKATTFVRRRTQRARIPLPVVTAHDDGRCDFACLSCPVRVCGLPDEATAKGWAENHRCAESTTADRRPWP
jgi:hypothetical protein